MFFVLKGNRTFMSYEEVAPPGSHAVTLQLYAQAISLYPSAFHGLLEAFNVGSLEDFLLCFCFLSN